MPSFDHSPWSRRSTSIVLLAAAVCLMTATARQAAAQFPDDATVLALEFDGPSGIIRPDPVLVAAIDAELALIRSQHPVLAEIHVFPAWMPGELLVRMTDEALAALEAGTFTGFDALFAEYPVANLHIFSVIPWVHITFVEALHAPNLVPLFLAVDGVTYAEPSFVVGDGSDITLHELGSYTFKYGWGDCMSGCINNHYWEIRIEDGIAIIVQEWGDDLPVRVEGVSWSQVRDLYR